MCWCRSSRYPTWDNFLCVIQVRGWQQLKKENYACEHIFSLHNLSTFNCSVNRYKFSYLNQSMMPSNNNPSWSSNHKVAFIHKLPCPTEKKIKQDGEKRRKDTIWFPRKYQIHLWKLIIAFATLGAADVQELCLFNLKLESRAQQLKSYFWIMKWKFKDISPL